MYVDDGDLFGTPTVQSKHVSLQEAIAYFTVVREMDGFSVLALLTYMLLVERGEMPALNAAYS
jgi:hypothetical protein